MTAAIQTVVPLVEPAPAPTPVDAGYTIIYSRRAAAAPVPTSGRVIAGGLAVGCLVLLLVAAWLVPSPNGFGTHTAMGLADCAFLARTGLPCPACGMTTSFSWFARGNLVASLYVQPMGTVLAIWCGMTVWVAGYIAATGRPLHRLFAVLPDRWYLIPLLSMAVVGWGWKMFIHLHGIDGWR